MSIKIQTKSFGEIEVKEKMIFTFPEGILGFDFVKKFVLLDSKDEKSPFKWLQAFDEPELAFIVIRPGDFIKDYKLVISQADLETVEAKRKEDLLVFAVVTIPENPAEMTANLQGPVIINPENNIGKQAISLSDKYSVKHKILDELKKHSGKKG